MLNLHARYWLPAFIAALVIVISVAALYEPPQTVAIAPWIEPVHWK